MRIPNNSSDEREQELLLLNLPDAATRYLSDNLRILLESKFETTYSGAPMRFSGDETKLLYEIHAYLRNQYESKSKGGAKSKRPPVKNDPKSIANRERVRKFRDKQKDG